EEVGNREPQRTVGACGKAAGVRRGATATPIDRVFRFGAIVGDLDQVRAEGVVDAQDPDVSVQGRRNRLRAGANEWKDRLREIHAYSVDVPAGPIEIGAAPDVAVRRRRELPVAGHRPDLDLPGWQQPRYAGVRAEPDVAVGPKSQLAWSYPLGDGELAEHTISRHPCDRSRGSARLDEPEVVVQSRDDRGGARGVRHRVLRQAVGRGHFAYRTDPRKPDVAVGSPRDRCRPRTGRVDLLGHPEIAVGP